MSLYDDILHFIPYGREVPSKIPEAHGGLVLSRKEAGALITILQDLDGAHVEVGTYFGGSAILAALVKPHGRVISIDNQITEHWSQGIVTEEKVRANLRAFGVEELVELVRSNSHPWPLRLWEEVTSAFIDGDECDQSECGGVLHDWLNLLPVVTRFIAFHDCIEQYPGVVRTVERASADPKWKLVESVDSIRIFERR